MTIFSTIPGQEQAFILVKFLKEMTYIKLTLYKISHNTQIFYKYFAEKQLLLSTGLS
jgi:hypothetical protein